MAASQSQRIILTGASAGIGRALAIEYAPQGAQMVLVGQREELLREVIDLVNQRGGHAVAVPVDITAPGAAQLIVDTAKREFGGVDTVIMNAGIGFPAWAYNFSAEETERVLEVNYSANVRMIEAVLPQMMADGRGRIVAVSSLAAYRGMPGSAAYNASKAALMILMESLRTELRGSGVTLTTIAPGFVRTEMTAKNEFYMPFLLEPADAARRMIRAINAGRSEYRFPLRLSLLVRLIQIMPNAVYDRLMRWGRKAAKQ